MNLKQAKREFAESYFLTITLSGNPELDKPRVREAWNVYVDDLQKAGEITESQASMWQNPFLSKKDR